MHELPFRQIHLDFHTSPYIGDVGTEFNGEEFVQTLKEAKVNSINVFAKCHHGNCYYPTKVGKVHPALKFDLLGEMLKVCKKEGIKAPIYFPIGWEEEAANHPEWLEVNMEGVLGGKKPFEDRYYSWRKLCHNKEGYIKYIMAQTQELLDMYEVDGFWYDIVFQSQCVCSDCLKEMRELGLDPQNMKDVKKHDFIVIKRFMERLYTYVKERKPDALVFFNMPITPDGGYEEEFNIKNKTKYLTQIEIESLPSGLWGYNHFPLLANYHNTGDSQIIGMNGKFHKAWGDFGSLRNREALEFECFRMLAAGAKCCIGDQLHPRGRLDKTVYKRIGEVYSQIEEREPWCEKSQKISEIAVLMANKPLDKEFDSDEGAMRMMMELHRPFDFIDTMTDFDKYKLIILPDRVVFDEKLTKKFEAYIEKGGKVIATYKSGMDKTQSSFIFKQLGVEYVEENPYCPSYVRMGEDFRRSIEEMDYVMYHRGVRVDAREGTEVLGNIVTPYFNRTYDRFCSHCQFPADSLTGWPAITRNRNVIYIANPLFADYMENGVRVYRDIIENCLNLLIEKPLIVTSLPTTAEAALRKQEGRTVLHMIHYIPQKKSKALELVDAKIPLYSIDVKVKLDDAPGKVYLAPSGKELDFEYRDGYVECVVPEVNGHQMLVMEHKH